MRRVAFLLPLLAIIAVLPLLGGGVSCGHDFEFHLQSWLDAAQQFRQGDLNPHWAFSAAYNAGEPRFIFYPPLSWTLGALLSLVLPLSAVPIAFTFVAVALACLPWFFRRLAVARRGPVGLAPEGPEGPEGPEASSTDTQSAAAGTPSATGTPSAVAGASAAALWRASQRRGRRWCRAPHGGWLNGACE